MSSLPVKQVCGTHLLIQLQEDLAAPVIKLLHDMVLLAFEGITNGAIRYRLPAIQTVNLQHSGGLQSITAA